MAIDDDHVYDYEDYLRESNYDQYSTLMELREGIETMDSDEFMEKYNSLSEEYQEAIDEDLDNFASGALGDDNWAANH